MTMTEFGSLGEPIEQTQIRVRNDDDSVCNYKRMWKYLTDGDAE